MVQAAKISITGTQRMEGVEPETLGLVTEGSYCYEPGLAIVSYVESEMTGLEGVVTSFTVEDGRTVTLSDFRGRVVMLQFTASWCGVCRKEMPFIEKDIWQKHKDNEAFALYGVDRDEPLDKVVAFAKQTGVTYPLGLDPGADIFAKYADRKAGITRNVLIDKAGKIVMLTRLYNTEEFASLCKKIDEMLAEK